MRVIKGGTGGHNSQSLMTHTWLPIRGSCSEQLCCPIRDPLLNLLKPPPLTLHMSQPSYTRTSDTIQRLEAKHTTLPTWSGMGPLFSSQLPSQPRPPMLFYHQCSSHQVKFQPTDAPRTTVPLYKVHKGDTVDSYREHTTLLHTVHSPLDEKQTLVMRVRGR